MTDSPQPYRVLARKYRPQRFSELVGQDAMVQTLANAIARGRLAHAFLLTGVRGVGKTSTARLIAKALNCVGPEGAGGPTIDPCGECEPCRAIAEGRHIDVVEMDAASHTGVDDVREIIEAVRYAAVSARYKVYIIDEVHMLSKNAFNALLKTLEEPPAHVKFLFATTELNKVPITVLSRCQRFDLKRISADRLTALFAEVIEKEGVSAEAEALALIARAAEGSARDGLSMLDQAIAHGEGEQVMAASVREMLGLSDRGVVRELFAAMVGGNAEATLDLLRGQYELGVEPGALFRALLDLVHGITRAKISRAGDPALSAEEREALADWSGRLSHGVLHRFWQMLLKGLDEVQTAPVPVDAAEMALLRLIHASSLPDPGALVRRLMESDEDVREAPAPAATPLPPAAMTAMPASADKAKIAPVEEREGKSAPAPAAMASAPVSSSSTQATEPAEQTAAMPADLAALEAYAEAQGAFQLAARIHDNIGLIDYAPGLLVFQPVGLRDSGWIDELRACLRRWFGMSWDVRIADGPAQPTLRAQAEAREAAARQRVLDEPLVAAARALFPDARLIDYGFHDNKVA